MEWDIITLTQSVNWTGYMCYRCEILHCNKYLSHTENSAHAIAIISLCISSNFGYYIVLDLSIELNVAVNYHTFYKSIFEALYRLTSWYRRILYLIFVFISVGHYKWENGFITTVFDITLLFWKNIYMKSTNEWYVAFLKLLEFYDLYLVITKKGTGRSHVMSRFSSRKNLIL